MRTIISIIICLQWIHLFAQEKRDNVWLLGYDSFGTDSCFGGMVMDFTFDTLQIYRSDREMNIGITNSSICDKEGNLLFYTNGIYIANQLGEIMENGNGLNPSQFTDDWEEKGLPLHQGALILPLPNDTAKYFLFHEGREYDFDDLIDNSTIIEQFYYSFIDLSLNNGLGEVLEKNVPVIEDILDFGKITATKHANGRDWWILIPKYDSKIFYRFLLTPNGVEEKPPLEVEEIIYSGLGQAVFSPDGSKYAILELAELNLEHLNIFDFDRCEGTLSNQIQIPYQDTAWSGGVAISPNSRFLYVSLYEKIIQYDLEASDIAGSGDTVAFYDGYEFPITPDFSVPTHFFLAQLAPNGKIYINCSNGVKTLHVINQPNLAGAACDVAQHSIDLPTYNRFSLPNFPNYNLGALEGSPCDTITSTKNPDIQDYTITLFPNPTHSTIQLELLKPIKKAGTFIIFNALGQEVFHSELSIGQNLYSFDLSDIASGIYFYKVEMESYKLKEGRLVIVK